MLSNATAVFRN